MTSTNVACAKFVGVGESLGVVEGMDSSLLSLENHGRPVPATAALGDEEPIAHVPEIITGDDIIRDLGLIVPTNGRSEAVPSQASGVVGLWGTGPAFGSVNLGSFGFGVNPIASVGGVHGRNSIVEARPVNASIVDMPYSRGMNDARWPSDGGSVGGLVLGSQNALRPVDTVAVSTPAHPFAGATFVDVSARAGTIGGCGRGSGSLLPTNARDSLFATLSWVEYDELYRCKAETDRMLEYISRLEVDCLVYK